ncbi:hypothetical protein C7H09_00070 [Marinobacter fuscus]|uniref:Lipoprotein n=2 Tax=Marinobacter fuscus TaxID=2109942 RepID=A0A2T1KW13_9GAMM|nr:hypothetical protein C7H09_00070 [Marinobacter fuscus]
MRHSLSLMSAAIVAVGLAGCSTPKVVDTTPLSDTSVVKASYIIGGYILPDSRGEQVTYTLADRRTIESTVEFDSWLSRQLFGESHLADIMRPDKSLQWRVDHKDESYIECPLEGCVDVSVWDQFTEEASEDTEEEFYDPSGGDSCAMVTSDFSFSVVPKDTGRMVNGFNADQYVAQWKMVARDELGREDKHLVTMDFWMAKANDQMRGVWDINGRFQDYYLSNVQEAGNPLSAFFTDSVYSVIAMVSGDISKTEIDTESEVVKGLTQLEGYPVSIKLEWFANNQACQQEKQTASRSGGFDLSDPVGSLGKLAEGMVKTAAEDKAKDYMGYGTDKPVLTYIYDVASAQVQPERASRFEVPADYKLKDRR